MEEVTRNTEITDGRERKRVLRVDVIIPTYKPGKKFSRLLKMLSMQTYPIGKIIVMIQRRPTGMIRALRASAIWKCIICPRRNLTMEPPETGGRATAGRISWYS